MQTCVCGMMRGGQGLDTGRGKSAGLLLLGMGGAQSQRPTSWLPPCARARVAVGTGSLVIGNRASTGESRCLAGLAMTGHLPDWSCASPDFPTGPGAAHMSVSFLLEIE